MRSILSLILLLGVLAFNATAADLYVNAANGTNQNPGTKQAPIKFLWRAMSLAKPGDTIHVAEGNQPGQGDSGCMPKIEISNLTILGGYKSDFSVRNPFQYYTTVIAPEDSKNKCRMPTFHAEKSDGKLDNVVIDGFVIDRAPLNTYRADKTQDNSKSPNGAVAITLIGRGGFQARNNVIMNSAFGGIYIKSGKDSAVKNNVIFSTVMRSIEIIAGSGWGKPTFTVDHNTSVFSYKFRSTEGRGVLLDQIGTYIVTNNLFAFNDESGVGLKFKNDNVELNNNQFFTNKYGDFVVGGQGGMRTHVKEFADNLTIKSAQGNTDADPKLAIDKAWLNLWLTRKDAVEGDVKYDTINAIRQAYGLNLQGGAGKPADNYAPRYSNWKEIAKLAGASTAGAQPNVAQ